jgi:hypothetical protein
MDLGKRKRSEYEKPPPHTDPEIARLEKELEAYLKTIQALK